jgi:hypothetical protein
MTTDTDLPANAVDHVSSMLALAKQKHGEAMAMIGIPDANAIPRLRQVLKLLDDVELLAEDAGSYVESDAMEQLEKLSKRSPWASPWPWVTLGLIVLMIIWSFD